MVRKVRRTTDLKAQSDGRELQDGPVIVAIKRLGIIIHTLDT
jgi:hypothetical protein